MRPPRVRREVLWCQSLPEVETVRHGRGCAGPIEGRRIPRARCAARYLPCDCAFPGRPGRAVWRGGRVEHARPADNRSISASAETTSYGARDRWLVAPWHVRAHHGLTRPVQITREPETSAIRAFPKHAHPKTPLITVGLLHARWTGLARVTPETDLAAGSARWTCMDYRPAAIAHPLHGAGLGGPEPLGICLQAEPILAATHSPDSAEPSGEKARAAANQAISSAGLRQHLYVVRGDLFPMQGSSPRRRAGRISLVRRARALVCAAICAVLCWPRPRGLGAASLRDLSRQAPMAKLRVPSSIPIARLYRREAGPATHSRAVRRKRAPDRSRSGRFHFLSLPLCQR